MATAAIVEKSGKVVIRRVGLMLSGDIDRPIYPRSAIKPLQALPLVESGAADAVALRALVRDATVALAASRSAATNRPTMLRAMFTSSGRCQRGAAATPSVPAGPDPGTAA